MHLRVMPGRTGHVINRPFIIIISDASFSASCTVCVRHFNGLP